ncbi:hypothetical protein AKJ16_DCAP19705 [Drosera capensis]
MRKAQVNCSRLSHMENSAASIWSDAGEWASMLCCCSRHKQIPPQEARADLWILVSGWVTEGCFPVFM